MNGKPQPYLRTVRCKLCKGEFSGVAGIRGFKIKGHTKYVCFDCLAILAPDAMEELADRFKYEAECATDKVNAVLRAIKLTTPDAALLERAALLESEANNANA